MRLTPLAGALFLAATVSSVAAETVTLRAPGGGFEVSGDFRDFDGSFYRIETEAGPLTLDAAGLVCEGPGCPGLVDVTLRLARGDAAAGRFFAKLIEDFAEARGIARAEGADGSVVLSLPNARARLVLIRDADPGAADLALMRRYGAGVLPAAVRGVEIGLDPLVPVVSPENPVTAMTRTDLAGLLDGAVGSWAELGGPDLAPVVHLGPDDDGPGGPLAMALGRPSAEAPEGAVIEEDAALVPAAIAGDPAGIGLLPMSMIGGTVPLLVTGPCGAGVAPAPLTVRTGDYPLIARVLLVRRRGAPGGVAREFVQFAEGAGAEAAMEAAGMVALSLRPAAPGETALYRRLVEGPGGAAPVLPGPLADAAQVPVTIRFDGGEMGLSAAGRVRVARLAAAMRSGVFDGRVLVLAGYSDDQGGATWNREISRRRAAAVAEALTAALGDEVGRVGLEIHGFGPASPVACNDVPWGQRLNRRVEVWLR